MNDLKRVYLNQSQYRVTMICRQSTLYKVPSPIFVLTAIVLVLASSLFPAESMAKSNQRLNMIKAQRLIEDGQELFKSKEYVEGIKLYKEADILFPDPKNLYMIALAHGQISNHCKESLDAWTQFFARCKSCKFKKRGETHQKKQRNRCTVKVTMESATPNTTARIGKDSWGTLPVTRDLVVQSYPPITFSAPGHFPVKQTLVLSPNQKNHKISVTLRPRPIESFFQKNRALIGWVTVGASAALIGVGVAGSNTYFETANEADELIRSGSDTSDWTRQSTRYNELKSEHESALTSTIVGLSLGVILAGTAAWILVGDDGDTGDSSASSDTKASSLRMTSSSVAQSPQSRARSTLYVAPNAIGWMGTF